MESQTKIEQLDEYLERLSVEYQSLRGQVNTLGLQMEELVQKIYKARHEREELNN